MGHEHILFGGERSISYAEKSLAEMFYCALKYPLDPNRILLIDAVEGCSYTAEQCFHKSIVTANKLYQMGLRKGDVVGVISPNHLDYPFGLIACIYLGAIINPLNPDYITREIVHAFGISKPILVITSAAKRKDVEDAKTEVNSIEAIITFEELNEEIIYSSSELQEIDEKLALVKGTDNDNDTAFILCSSGTTGFPKGVSLTNLNFKHVLSGLLIKGGIGLDCNATFIAMLPFYHLFGFVTILSSILQGSLAVLLNKFKPELYLKTIESYRVTILFVVPPLAVFLAKSPLTAHYNLTSISDIICGAAPLGTRTQSALEDKLGIPIRQMYGLTETSAVTLTPLHDTRFPGSAGKLLSNIRAKVVHIDDGKTLGANEIGEFCFKGPTLMKCYHDNETATKEMFDCEGFLRTGDIGYYNEEGFIFIVDRQKELIKYKGFQVAPAELEDILMKHPLIKDAAVIGIKDEQAGELTKAYIVRAPNCELSEEEVKAFVAQNVSFQKRLHGGVQFIDNIPKSGSGKILRRQLRQMYEQ